jgi:hypothetical protein
MAHEGSRAGGLSMSLQACEVEALENAALLMKYAAESPKAVEPVFSTLDGIAEKFRRT